MSTEDRLRDALHAEAAQIEPREGWTMIESRLAKAGSPNRTRLLAFAAAAALVLVAAVAVITQQSDDGTPVVTEPTTTTTPAAPATTVTPTTEPVELGPRAGILWDYSAATPRAIAELFARDFLNMPNPNVGAYQSGDSRSGEVVIRPRPTGSQATTLTVRELDGQWYVLAAEATNLELDTPAAQARITSPVHLSGRSIAFEGTVRVAVLRYGTTLQCTVPTDVCGSDPGVYANTFFTGHGTEKGPFATDVTFNTPQTEYGYVVLWTDSAEDGTVSEATVRLIRFR